MYNFVILALIATLFTWFVTALGAATVLFFKTPNPKILNIMLGFAAGVMIAASFWSLLAPAIEMAEDVCVLPPFCVATFGFLCGALFIWLSDIAISFARNRIKRKEKNKKFNRIFMLILSITLHNIPEGLAVGVAFGALKNGYSNEALMGAVSVAIGIGLQNFPEGAAVSLPLRRDGYNPKKCFLMGQASGMVEPISGVLGALLVARVEQLLPFSLSFAAGAMVLVAVHELIPECQINKKENSYFSTMGIVCGFALMMLLDVMLG